MKHDPWYTLNAHLYIGRFQPFHLGHVRAINNMKGNEVVRVICLITSQIRSKESPFSAELREKMIKAEFPNNMIKIIHHPNGYLPDIINSLDDRGFGDPQNHYRVTDFYCGKDRMDEYQRQINTFNEKVEKEDQLHFNWNLTGRHALESGTTVRRLLEEGKFDDVAKYIPDKSHRFILPLYKEYENLQRMANNDGRRCCSPSKLCQCDGCRCKA